jgi:hypothetical protein
MLNANIPGMLAILWWEVRGHCDIRFLKTNMRLMTLILLMVCLNGFSSPIPVPSYKPFGSSSDDRSDEKPRPGFGIGPAACYIVKSGADQPLFPGFNVMSVWHSHEWMVEFRGRFFFGEIDTYQLEAAGYRPVTDRPRGWFAGGGIGYGGMNSKELLVFNINNIPVPGLFYHNGNGFHAFLGTSRTLYVRSTYTCKVDFDYFIALYNVDELRLPSGVRVAFTLILHAR